MTTSWVDFKLTARSSSDAPGFLDCSLEAQKDTYIPVVSLHLLGNLYTLMVKRLTFGQRRVVIPEAGLTVTVAGLPGTRLDTNST